MSTLRQIRWPLGRALVVYLILLSLIATLVPFRFRWPPDMVLGWSIPLDDLVYNILFFLPLGFIYRLTRGVGRDPWHLEALGIGLALSATIEILQLCLPGRVTSFSDVAANGIGMWIGSMIHDRLQSRVDGFLLGRLTLELPLVMLVYLLVPLMWINARAARLDPDRIWLQGLLGVIGAVVIASLRVHRAGPVARMEKETVLFAAAVWFALGSIPAMAKEPEIVLISGAVSLAAAALVLFVPILVRTKDRRFEIPVMLRVGPLYLTYLVLLALWPWPDHWKFSHFNGSFGLDRMRDGPGDVAVLQLLEYTISFTILGYVLAQIRGRVRETRAQALIIAMVLCGILAGMLEILQGYHPKQDASAVQFMICTGAGTYGAYLYQAQLATIRLILAR